MSVKFIVRMDMNKSKMLIHPMLIPLREKVILFDMFFIDIDAHTGKTSFLLYLGCNYLVELLLLIYYEILIFDLTFPFFQKTTFSKIPFF